MEAVVLRALGPGPSWGGTRREAIGWDRLVLVIKVSLGFLGAPAPSSRVCMKLRVL